MKKLEPKPKKLKDLDSKKKKGKNNKQQSFQVPELMMNLPVSFMLEIQVNQCITEKRDKELLS